MPRARPLIGLLTAGSFAMLTLLRGADLWWRRQGSLQEGERRAANLALILSEYLRQAFQAADASLRQLVVHGRRVGGPAAASEDWAQVLASAKAGLSGIGSVSVLDAEGTIRHSTQELIVGQSRHDQYLFRRLAGDTGDRLVANTPFRILTGQQELVIPLGRRLTREDGGFDGMVVATFFPAGLRGFFQVVDVGAGGAFWVFHPDGLVLFHEPSRENPIGETASGNPIFEAARGRTGPGTLRGRIGRDGPALVSAFRPIQDPPLLVAVSLAEPDLLADWRREVFVSAGVLAFLGLAGAAALALLFRQIDARAAAEGARHESEERSEELRRLASRLEAANKELEAFTYSVSHDLRAPLRAIDGFSRLIEDKHASQLDAEGKRLLSVVRRSSQQMGQLIDDLLALSRLGRQEIRAAQVDVASLIGRIFEELRSAAPGRELSLKLGALPPAYGDPVLIRQAFVNLLSNAVKFTKGRETATIAVEARASPGENVYVVSDNGVGFDMQYAHKLFGVFQRLHTAAEFDGTGVGLAIVQRVALRHGGRVWGEGRPGEGASFYLALPVKPAAAGEARGAAATSRE